MGEHSGNSGGGAVAGSASPARPEGQGGVGARRGVRVPQQARSRRTRKRIVEAAMLAFEEGGYDETTTAVIAKRAGIAVGTLYGYFQNKRDILLEVVDHTLGEVSDLVVEQLDPATWRGRDPRDVVRTLIDTLFHIQTIRPGTQRVIYERYFKDEEFRGLVEAREEPVREAIVRFLDSVGPEHRPRALDREAAALAIYNAVQWNATQAIMGFSDDPAAIDAAAREAADMIERYVFE